MTIWSMMPAKGLKYIIKFLVFISINCCIPQPIKPSENKLALSQCETLKTLKTLKNPKNPKTLKTLERIVYGQIISLFINTLTMVKRRLSAALSS